MGSSQFFSGGTLNPPPNVTEEQVSSVAAIVARIADGQPDLEWTGEEVAAFDQARALFQRCQQQAESALVHVVVERVHELGAAGPGRAIRVAVSWNQEKTGLARRTFMYGPPKFATLPTILFLRNLFEHCAIV